MRLFFPALQAMSREEIEGDREMSKGTFFRCDYCAELARFSKLKATLKAPYLLALSVLLSCLGVL
jgi:hypothetical protein